MEYLKFIKNPVVKAYLWRIKQGFKYFQTRERKVSYGKDNPDQTFYVICIKWSISAGLFAVIKSILSHIDYAIERGMIPVVNMQDSINGTAFHHFGTRQEPWEVLFEQPSHFSLADLKSSKHIIKSCTNPNPKLKYGIGVNLIEDKQRLSHLHQLFRSYIRPSSTLQSFLEKEYRQTINPQEKILGVLCRGTDYTLKRPKGHPVQPNPKEVIEKAKEVMAERKCDRIYLATEDVDAYNLFKEHFGDKLLANNYQKYGSADFQGVDYISQIVTDSLKQQQEYLSSIYILSRCSCFLGGRTSGTIGVYLLKEGNFEYDYTWDKGYY